MKTISIAIKEDKIPDNFKKALSFSKEKGYFFEDTQKNRTKFNDIMPLGYKENVRLRIDLIPSTSWYSSLANSLTRESWTKIRKVVVNNCANKCQVCGSKNTSTCTTF